MMPDDCSPVRRAVILRRVGTQGRERVQVFDDEEKAAEALEALARAKRRRGYRDL